MLGSAHTEHVQPQPNPPGWRPCYLYQNFQPRQVIPTCLPLNQQETLRGISPLRSRRSAYATSLPEPTRSDAGGPAAAHSVTLPPRISMTARPFSSSLGAANLAAAFSTRKTVVLNGLCLNPPSLHREKSQSASRGPQARRSPPSARQRLSPGSRR